MRGFAQNLLWSSETCARSIIQPGLITKDHRVWARGCFEEKNETKKGHSAHTGAFLRKCIVMRTLGNPSGVCALWGVSISSLPQASQIKISSVLFWR